MVAFVVSLNVLAFVLPTAGFVHFLYRAQREVDEVKRKFRERGTTHATYDDVDVFAKASLDEPMRKRHELLVETVFVGLGMLAGMIASIWSLYLPAS